MGELSAADYERARNERLLNDPGWFPARFAGACVACGNRFTPGTPVARDRRGSFGGWVGACCADTVDDE